MITLLIVSTCGLVKAALLALIADMVLALKIWG